MNHPRGAFWLGGKKDKLFSVVQQIFFDTAIYSCFKTLMHVS